MNALLLLATLLLAADAKIVGVEGAPKAGRDGAWRVAKAGEAIAEDELLLLAAGESVEVELAGGRKKTVQGRAIVAMRRLAASGSTDKAVLLAKAAHVSSRNIEAAELSTAVAPRGAEIEDAPQGTGRRAVAFLGADDAMRPKSTDADFAEWYLRQSEYRLAVAHAWRILESSEAPASERRRAHLVLAAVWVREGALGTAIGDLDAAAAPSEDPALAPFRASALARRGQLRMQLGEDDTQAEADFEAAIDAAPDSNGAAIAHFFLGTLALSRGDEAVAKARFARLTPYPELKQAADELLAD